MRVGGVPVAWPSSHEGLFMRRVYNHLHQPKSAIAYCGKGLHGARQPFPAQRNNPLLLLWRALRTSCPISPDQSGWYSHSVTMSPICLHGGARAFVRRQHGRRLRVRSGGSDLDSQPLLEV